MVKELGMLRNDGTNFASRNLLKMCSSHTQYMRSFSSAEKGLQEFFGCEARKNNETDCFQRRN